jgi:predicted TIM-barrel fold metal-dependent hydrolase
MGIKHISRGDLAGKVIDIHAHVGVGLKPYACIEFPYAQTVEGLYFRQLAGGVDVNVIFPYSPDLFFDLHAMTQGEMTPARRPISHVPYGVENRMLLTEVFVYCPELKDRFIPFVCADPARMAAEQVREFEKLEEEFPIQGIKIVPVSCQAPVIELLGSGRAVMDFARERHLPLLIHTTGDPNEGYSQPRDIFRVIERYPDLRFCLAHCICFNRRFLELADECQNVWVDTAALKIQVQMVHEESPFVTAPAERFDADYSDHTRVMLALMERFPGTIVWGTDSPAYSYICRRKQAEGSYGIFRLKGLYQDEIDALNALPPELRVRACNANSIAFLFGQE